MQLLTKLSAKKLIGKIEKPTKKTALFRVLGIATGVKTGESTYGPWVAFLGQFRAIRNSDNEVFQAGQCFLPAMASNLMLPVVNQHGDTGVEFAFDIGVVPAENAIGYEYFAEPIVESGETDALAALQKKVDAKALPAPEKHKK